MSPAHDVIAAARELWLTAASPASSPADPSCNVSEVQRLLWTVIVVALAAGVVAVVRPRWRLVAALVTAALTWLWIDMEGPVLASRGTHGVHLADIPVIIALAAAGTAALRLVLRRRRHVLGGPGA